MRLGFKERQLGQHLQALQENFAIQTELAGRERREQRVHGVPLPPPEPPDDGVLTPQDQLKTSISSLCLESVDSPLMLPILPKMFAAS